jgi:hypothetical protein
MVLFLSLSASPANSLIDALVSILTAPTRNEHELMTGFSILSLNGVNIERNSFRSFKEMWFSDEETIKIPEFVLNSHNLAGVALRTLNRRLILVASEKYSNTFGEVIQIDPGGIFFNPTSRLEITSAKHSLGLFFTQIFKQYEILSGTTRRIYAQAWG